ncbi:hypothetical protein GCM10023196_035900 [Actinoallomurus vinaceus]|uniref:Uncharacterized protein n=1 Tax=Actinoallomurus vinaceus TaxID=1080074 RepID=A0ABP8UBN8_9ACTN
MTTPVRHDPPDGDACGDEFADDFATCVCQLPDGHDSDGWHDCACGQTWHTAYAPREATDA